MPLDESSPGFNPGDSPYRLIKLFDFSAMAAKEGEYLPLFLTGVEIFYPRRVSSKSEKETWSL